LRQYARVQPRFLQGFTGEGTGVNNKLRIDAIRDLGLQAIPDRDV